jgi:hypothetical protein
LGYVKLGGRAWFTAAPCALLIEKDDGRLRLSSKYFRLAFNDVVGFMGSTEKEQVKSMFGFVQHTANKLYFLGHSSWSSSCIFIPLSNMLVFP